MPDGATGIDLFAQGFDFICYSGDVWVLHDALRDAIGKLREGCGASERPKKARNKRDRAFSRRSVGRFPQTRWVSRLSQTSTSSHLRRAPNVELAFLEPRNPVEADQIADFDALILLAHRFTKESIHPNRRLAVVARFGVGYDTVDVEACTSAGIALVITPDGVRRPVAVSIITLILALTGKLIVKDQLTREGAAGFSRRGEHMGVGLVGRTLGSVGVGNIGAELFRLIKPFDMKLIAHDPYAELQARRRARS